MKKIKIVTLLLAPALIVLSCHKKEQEEIPQDYTCVCTWETNSGPQTASVKFTQVFQKDAVTACAHLESNFIDASCALQ